MTDSSSTGIASPRESANSYSQNQQNWRDTLWNSKLHLETPMLFALGGVVMFLFSGITGVMLGAVPFDKY